MAESFWVKLLDLFREHGVTSLEPLEPDQPARVVLTYDETLGKGTFFLSNIRVRTPEDTPLVQLPGSRNLAVHITKVSVETVPRHTPKGLVKYAAGLANELLRR